MKIYIGSDHAGFELKKAIFEDLKGQGNEVLDLGTFDGVNKVDYPDIAREVSEKVVENGEGFGILICGTGMGMAIAANKVKGIRAVTAHDVTTARLARLHNDANVLTFGERVIGPEVAKDMVKTFLNTSFEGGRHAARVEKIMQLQDQKQHGE